MHLRTWFGIAGGAGRGRPGLSHHAPTKAAELALRHIGEVAHIGKLIDTMHELGYQHHATRATARTHIVPSLDNKSKKNRIVTKPALATYGLIEWETKGGDSDA